MATTPTKVFFPPRHVPGEGMAEVVQNAPLRIKSERLTDANLVVGANQIFDLPANTYVHDIRVRIVAAFDQSMSLTIGDGDDADRFMDDTQIAPATIGWKSMIQDTNPGSGGHLYAAADTIDATRGGGTPTTGSADVHLFYIPRADEAGF